MENTFYVVNEIYTPKNDNYNDSIILEYYTQNKDDFLRHLELELGIYLEDFDGSYKYINGYEMFKTDVNELLEYIYEYPINFTNKFRSIYNFNREDDDDYDLTISRYFCLLRDKLETISNVKQGMLYDLVDMNNKIVIETEQGYFLNYLIHFIDKTFGNLDRNELVREIVKSYTK